MGRRPKVPDLVSHMPTDWAALAFVEEPRAGRVYRIDQRTLADGTKETRRVDVTRERARGWSESHP